MRSGPFALTGIVSTKPGRRALAGGGEILSTPPVPRVMFTATAVASPFTKNKYSLGGKTL